MTAKIMCLSLLLSVAAAAAAPETVELAAFGKVALYRGPGPLRHVALFVSGDGGWNLGVVDMAKAVAGMDALVAGIDIVHYLKRLERSKSSCSYPAGDLEQLSQFIQKREGLAEYLPPCLIGYSSGATLIYAALVQAPAGTFSGGVSLGFCPDLPLQKPFCRGNGLRWDPGPKGKGVSFLPAENLQTPWVAFQGSVDQVCSPTATEAFVRQVKNGSMVRLDKVGHGFSVQKNWLPQFKKTFQDLVQPKAAPLEALPALPAEVGDLPLIEALPERWRGEELALIISGDGGWASIDKSLARELNGRGLGVVGLNSLKYFWKKRSPDEAGEALRRILEHYLPAWKKEKALLIGYSLGADVLPFMVRRLPPALKNRIRKMVFLGPSRTVEFEFHVSDWLGGSAGKDALPLLPEVEQLAGMPLLFVRGEEEEESLCDILPAGLGRVVTMKGGHHFGGDYAALASLILQEAPD